MLVSERGTLLRLMSGVYSKHIRENIAKASKQANFVAFSPQEKYTD
jgi:hypothetical protein